MGRVGGIVFAGVVSGLAYMGAQAVDLAISRNRTDDRVLLGRLTPVAPGHARAAGLVLHLVNSVIFSAVFRLLVRDVIKGPMWLRGVLFANIENAGLFPIFLFEDYHPAIRDGQLDSYQNGPAFAQQVWRHTALGMVLGALTPEKD